MSEEQRLSEIKSGGVRWKLWGPYLSERQWGTVREDYSEYGTAWDYFTHDMARSRAYRWGEDGIAGISDDRQNLCFALALWNGKDPILKERLFGLNNGEGNHGEDVKELYYYLDATPTNSYLKMLYKYPQRAYPYADLVAENRRGSRDDPEYEILDTGVFAENRYFDIFVEYAKAAPDDILILVTAHNRGPDEAPLYVIPQLWFRNTWSWGYPVPKPRISQGNQRLMVAQQQDHPDFHLYGEGSPDQLFCDNDTNVRRLYGMNAEGFFKDAFHERIVDGNIHATNPECFGTKACIHYATRIKAGESAQFRLRLSVSPQNSPFTDFDRIVGERRSDADEFYGALQKNMTSPDERMVQRQALAGMIWNKQFFNYDVHLWLQGDPASPPPPEARKHGRNHDWKHINDGEILSMPDKWEYPWFASWDTAFHTVALALIDPEFAKRQLILLIREWYMHPNGQLPAYEWSFGDVNPPVHGWAAWRVFQIDRKKRQAAAPTDPGDLAFLERVFHKLMLNFTWWVNRKDTDGRNIFQGGFLGLDNVGVFDRSRPLPTGGYINQSDGTSWMAMYSLNLMRIALELAKNDHVYEDIASKFFEHFLYIAQAMTHIGSHNIGLWDEQDGFFYDVLHLPSGEMIPMRLRSAVGLIPLFAVETLEPEMLNKLPGFTARLEWFLHHRPDLASLVSRWQERGTGERRLLSLLRGSRMKKLLRRMLDETEFLSENGVRALSRYHRDHPYTFTWAGGSMSVRYEPAESQSGVFGGNSNWRGPVWMPLNFLMIESLQKFHYYYGDEFKIECPTGSGKFMTIDEVAHELARRLSRLFLRNENGRRPFQGDNLILQNDPHFRDLILFYEYFDGDNGSGKGASHQTGWTGLAAKLLMPRAGQPADMRPGEHLEHI